MTKLSLLTTLAGLTACGALAPASAPAAPAYQSAAFKADLRGTQVSTWEYHEDTLKEPCGSKLDAFGDQTIRFASKGKGRLIVGRPAGGKATAVFSDGTVPGPWAIPAEADRNGTWTAVQGDTSACEDNGGGAPPRRDKQCGKRTGTLTPDADVAGKAKMLLGGRIADWGGVDGQSLDDTYVDCPFWSNGPYAPEAEGHLLPAAEKLPMKKLLDPSRRRIVVDFGIVRRYGPENGFVGKTIVTAKLTLTRTKLTVR